MQKSLVDSKTIAVPKQNWFKRKAQKAALIALAAAPMLLLPGACAPSLTQKPPTIVKQEKRIAMDKLFLKMVKKEFNPDYKGPDPTHTINAFATAIWEENLSFLQTALESENENYRKAAAASITLLYIKKENWDGIRKMLKDDYFEHKDRHTLKSVVVGMLAYAMEEGYDISPLQPTLLRVLSDTVIECRH